MTNSKWQISRVGLVDFWYYDEEEFQFLDGRMLLRGANGSGKSVTMQSFIPLLLDGNMRPERLDPFGSRARKMDNYLLEDGDGREERTGYLYMEFQRTGSGEYLTLGVGMRARRNRKLDTWYFCITDGRRVGKEILLYKDASAKITCSARELKNRIGEGGRVMDTQSEYAQCVNRLLFGFETQEEYKELLELLIQLRTPKLSKDFKPSLINEILSNSLQTLSEDDLRPMSEAIENMDSLRINLEALHESIHAAEQIEKVYDRYNESVLLEKATLYTQAAKQCRELEADIGRLQQERAETDTAGQQEQAHYDELTSEWNILSKEKSSLDGSDAFRLKEREQEILKELRDVQKSEADKQRQLQGKQARHHAVLDSQRKCGEANAKQWDLVEECLKKMEAAIESVPFEDFSFMKTELCENREQTYSFPAHSKLLEDYIDRVEAGRDALQKEEACHDLYSRQLEELDRRQKEQSRMERELVQWENQLHETKQELTEQVYRWEHGNQVLRLPSESLQEISRRIEQYQHGTDYWSIRDAAKPVYEALVQENAEKRAKQKLERDTRQAELAAVQDELEQWRGQKEPEPERSEAVLENRRLLAERGIPYRNFYQLIDFDKRLSEAESAMLEEALLEMGILDALVIPAEYREQVLALDGAVCDRYLFTDAPRVRDSLLSLFRIENPERDFMLYQDMTRALSAIGMRAEPAAEAPQAAENGTGGSWIGARGHYGMGALEGTITGTYTSRYIGARSRERFRMEKIRELETLCEQKEALVREAEASLAALEEQGRLLEREWKNFPGGQDLLTAAQECERRTRLLAECRDRVREQMECVNEARRKLDEIRLQVQELCRKCYLPVRLDAFEDALRALRDYRKLLTQLQLSHHRFVSGTETLRSLTEQLAEIDSDLEDLRHEHARYQNRKRETEGQLHSVQEQLKLTNYAEIRARLDACITRLNALPDEKEASVKRRTDLENRSRSLQEKQSETERQLEQAAARRERFAHAFAAEYDLGYVGQMPGASDNRLRQAEKVCSMLSGTSGGKKKLDLQGDLQEVFHKNRGSLAEYQITLRKLFEELDEGAAPAERSLSRIDITAKYRGTPVKFKGLTARLREDAEVQQKLLSDRDRELFEDILANTISKKIRAKIQASRRWVEKMNRLMESMKTSSGLTLSLRWKNLNAETEEQLDTKDLVELLEKDAEIMRPEETERLSRHFRSKIGEARKLSGDTGNTQSFHTIMREVLDYRKWFEFQLESRKTGEQKKVLTDRVFYTFSGGEKAMAMYVPLFSAVAAKYAGARADAPHLISLDEAFAGVDEMNIRDMFRLMVEFDFNFMINSQILWGDYDTVPALAVYQLIRPENAHFVSVIRYIWNGTCRRMATEEEMEAENTPGADNEGMGLLNGNEIGRQYAE